MNNGAKVLVVGEVSTVVLGRGQKRIVSWDEKAWGSLVSGGFVRVLDVWDEPATADIADVPESTPNTEPDPAETVKPRRARAKKVATDE